MSMSRDRVRFKITAYMAQSDRFVQLVKDIFDIDLKCYFRNVQCYNMQDSPLVVSCRPSQFARFLIERNNRGFAYEFKALEPVLVCGEECPRLVDASTFPNNPRKLTYST